MISSRCSGLSAISNCVRVELTRAHIVRYEGHLHSRLSYNICDVDQLVKVCTLCTISSVFGVDHTLCNVSSIGHQDSVVSCAAFSKDLKSHNLGVKLDNSVCRSRHFHQNLPNPRLTNIG